MDLTRGCVVGNQQSNLLFHMVVTLGEEKNKGSMGKNETRINNGRNYLFEKKLYF